MKYLKELSSLNLFSFDQAKQIIGSTENTKRVLKMMVKEKYITKITHNYYGINDLVCSSIYASKYEIACKKDASNFISHHSVFEYYGLYNQVYNSIDISSNKRQKNYVFEYDEYVHHLCSSYCQVNKIGDVYITTIERAIVDIINDSKDFEFEELQECISLLNEIKIERIIEYLEILNINILYKKVGYVLSLYKEKFNIEDKFFDMCKEKSGSSRGYYDNTKKEVLKYNAFWQLYV